MKKKFPKKIIKLIFAFLFLTSPSLLSAQVTADASMPFGQGQLVDSPGTTGYLGDMPHDINLVHDEPPYHTLAGLAYEQPGWRDGITAPGLNNAPVGIFFDDIPYPFASSTILNWMPPTGPFELLGFPAGAWWGPSASRGAVQLQSPPLTSGSETSGSVWGGTGGFGGGMGRYQDPIFSVIGDFQHGVLTGLSPFDTFTALSKMDWIKDDSFKLESGFLGSQWLSNDSWYSFYTSIRFDSPNFQSLQVKPFFQSAKWGSQDVREMGARIQYQFNLAGLIESHLVGGGSRDYFSPGVEPANSSKEFIQNTETFDALGFINGDVAFRWDFSTDAKTIFSTLLGMQGNLGDFFLLGDYAEGVDASSLETTQQVDLGARCQPDDIWNLTCQYIHEQMGTVLWDGARVKLQLEQDSPLLIVFKRVKFEMTEQPLLQQGGSWTNDVGGELRFGLFQGDQFWLKGRGLSGQPFYSEIGTGYSLSDHLGIFVSVANLNNLPTSWPDPISLEGRVFWFGIESKS